MKEKPAAREAIVVEARPVSVLFLRLAETGDGFVWEIRCYGADCAVQTSLEAYRTMGNAQGAGRAALADFEQNFVRWKLGKAVG